jgi:hypothetical protein
VATWFERLRSPFGREEEVEVGPASAGEPPGPTMPEAILEQAVGSAGGRP